MSDQIPRAIDDYTHELAAARRSFVRERTGAGLAHVGGFSFDPKVTDGNVEGFLGVAQVPLGLAGPMRVNGEHAVGDFLVPMATTEGTLVASYNRGMKLTRAAGGVTTTVSGDAMQRAPVFMFASAREAREFGYWVADHVDEIKARADATTRSGSLCEIEQYSASRFLFLRFDFTTGDAAGQNMVGKATAAACYWIRDVYPGIEHYYLESNFATDKKTSQINVLKTRGKRVTAEITLPDALIRENTQATAAMMYRLRQVGNVGSWMSLTNNNGFQSPNGITAMFIATGQDVANVAESSAAVVYTELRDNGYYYSITIPSLIVATYGGGTGLPTQRECLEMLDCYGAGKVRRLAEIVAATVLCGELSLGAAIAAEEWVTAHDQYGRNRP